MKMRRTNYMASRSLEGAGGGLGVLSFTGNIVAMVAEHTHTKSLANCYSRY